jgi:hypothetical protein
MSIIEYLKSFVTSHKQAIQDIEKMTLNEAISALRVLYPQDVVLLAIVDKIVTEIEVLQGIK